MIDKQKTILTYVPTSFFCRDSKSVVLANSSVNYKTQNWPSNILTYVRKMKFSRGHTVFETSMLTPLSVLLFSHNDIHCWEVRSSCIIYV